MTLPGSTLPGKWCSETSIWQLVESGGYSADLEAWYELARGTRTGVLDLGCGIGRVAHHLARHGIPALGIDRDAGVVADFNRLSPDPGTRAVVGDVRNPGQPVGLDDSGWPDPPHESFDRVIAPQQLIQILGGPEGRAGLIHATAGRLTAGGVAGFAFSEELPEESSEPLLLPDLREPESWIYSSRPTRLTAGPDSVTIERLRQRVSPTGELTETTDRTTLDRLDRRSLEAEFSDGGLEAVEWSAIPATDVHVGSVVAVARRAG